MRVTVNIFVFIFLYTFSFSQQQKDTLTLFFEIDQHGLTQAHTEIIDSFIQTKNIDSIQITAYTDYLGTQIYNVSLSQKRAYNTYSYLVKKENIHSQTVNYQGLGVFPNSNPSDSKNTENKGISAHRKVKIWLYSTVIEKQTDKANQQTILFNEEELEVGSQIVIENILFVGGTAYFKPESKSALEELLKIMEHYQNLEIEIQGHICCQVNGADGYDIINKNYHLSINRAKTVYDYLVSAGINSDRMTYKGFGSSNKRFPFERNEKEEDMNRRVEIKILNK